MGSKNYILPEGSLTLNDQRNYRLSAIAAGLARATEKKIGTISDDEIAGYSRIGTPAQRQLAIKVALDAGWWPTSMDVREFQPIADAGAALDQWNTAALAVVGTAYSCFQAIAAPAMGANKLGVFWKVGVETAPMPVSRLIFRTGGAAGNIVGVYDLEQLANMLESVGYLSEPVVIDPTITFAVQALCRIAIAAIGRVQLGAFIIEPAGQTIA